MAASERFGRAMASSVHLLVIGGRPGLPDDALSYLEYLEHRWSRFLPTSDITRLNLSAGQPVAVASETVVLVSAMVEGWRATGGAYDPTVLAALVRHGYSASITDPTRTTLLPPATWRADGSGSAPASVADVVVDAATSTVTLPAGLLLDPGGIGKGLAADLVVAELLSAGAAGALAGIGGDLAAAGEADDADGWEVGVEDPLDDAREICSFVFDSGGVATSSTRSRRWLVSGESRHHLMDPTTGAPTDGDLASVTVVARSGWLAEAHAKGALLAGSHGFTEYLADHDLSGLGVRHDGAVVASDDLRSLVEMEAVR